VRDIIDGDVDIDDVLVVISRTDFDPHDDEQWDNIWQGYHGGSIMSNPEWATYPAEDEAKFRDVSKQLWEEGKLHQPRKFGAHPRRLPYYWLETFAPEDQTRNNPMVKEAWDKYKTLAGLIGN
jgi:hypothetical protein